MNEEISETQTGFRKNYGTWDNIHTLRQLIEKTKEYRIPLFLCMIDIQKAFDRVHHVAIWESLRKIGVHPQLIHLLRSIYENSTSSLQINEAKVPITIQRGVRQGDVLSPQLFSIVLDLAMKKLDWSSTGIRIDGTYLSHILYADDAVLVAPNKRTLRRMIKEFMAACSTVGLNINMAKCEYLHNQNDDSPLKFNNVQLAPKPQVTYLGVTISMPLNWDKEVSRRISSGWCAYNDYRNFFKTQSIPMKMKRKLFNVAVLPRLIYASESWALPNTAKDRLRVTQRKMERSMLNCRIQDRFPNAGIRRITGLNDVCREAAFSKIKFCSRLSHLAPSRWSLRLTNWCPYNRKRSAGRPSVRWKDDLVAATQAANRTRQRVRARPAPIRGEQYLSASRDPAIWRHIRDHHIEMI